MKVVDRFKRRILDLAIRGKLVPQDPNDEPASELLARIRAEKAKDERGGRGRKGKRSAVGFQRLPYQRFSVAPTIVIYGFVATTASAQMTLS